MRNPFKIFLLVIISLIVVSGCSKEKNVSESDESKEDYTIRFSIVGTEKHPMSQALNELKNQLEEDSGGRMKIDFFPNGQLYPGERETNEAIQLGNIEMTVATTASLSSFHKDLMVLDLPYLFETREKAYEVLDGEYGSGLLKGLEDVQIKPLGFQENGFRQIINNKKEIRKPSDLKGLKMRVLPSLVYQDSMNALGADASPLAFGEVYSALQTGTYDGMENTVDVISDGKFYEVQKYLTLSNTFYAPNVAIISKKFYDELPEDLQEILVEWSNEFNQRSRQIMSENEDEYIKLLSEEIEVIELTNEEKDLFKQEFEPVYDKYREVLGDEIIDGAIKATE